MQHRLKRGRGFIIRNANREAAALRVAPVFEGGARINDDAALTTTPCWRPACIGAVARTGDAQPAPLPALRRACRPHSASSRAAARTGDAQPAPLAPASSRRPAITAPPPTLVSDPKHLSHTATLWFTNTDISSVPYKTP